MCCFVSRCSVLRALVIVALLICPLCVPRILGALPRWPAGCVRCGGECWRAHDRSVFSAVSRGSARSDLERGGDPGPVDCGCRRCAVVEACGSPDSVDGRAFCSYLCVTCVLARVFVCDAHKRARYGLVVAVAHVTGMSISWSNVSGAVSVFCCGGCV